MHSKHLRLYFASFLALTAILLPVLIYHANTDATNSTRLAVNDVRYWTAEISESQADSMDHQQTVDVGSHESTNSETEHTDAGNFAADTLQRFLPASPRQADTINQFAATTEILGPLTPLAMSPFFGITVLCGMTQVPEGWPFSDWLSDNILLGSNPVLRHPATFWIFLILTFATSLPRFTKVTKPVAQALDWIESYAGLITSLLIFAMGLAMADPALELQSTVAQAGFIAWTWNAILLAAAVVNFIVVKSVRFFFEVLIWICPVPLVDGLFEIANKGICLILLIIYATSPTLAFVLNLLAFAACLVILNWAQRRVNYHWHMWFEPVIQWLLPKYKKFDGKNLWVYCEQDFPPFKKYDRLHVYRWDDHWMLMRYDWFWKKKFVTFTSDDLPMLETTATRNALVLQQQVPVRFAFHRGYTAILDQIGHGLEISTKERVDFRAKRAIDEAEAAAKPKPT